MLLLAQIWLMVKNRMCIACQYPACQTNDRAGSGYLARVYLVLYFRLYFTPEFLLFRYCVSVVYHWYVMVYMKDKV